jgi:hypothetical protein
MTEKRVALWLFILTRTAVREFSGQLETPHLLAQGLRQLRAVRDATAGLPDAALRLQR